MFLAALLPVLISEVNAVDCDMFPDLRSWFRDDSSHFFDQELEKKTGTMGRTNQMFADFDGDGNLDFFFNNHNTVANPGEMRGRWMWGTVSEQTLSDGTTAPIVASIDMTYNNIDPPVPVMQAVMDAHGTAILDIDGDGYKDLYVAVGGGKGVGIGINYASVLFWGGPTQDGEVWNLSGGAYTALEAGLENDGGNGRGRFSQFADFNNDGLLDVLLVNDVRKDLIHSPSRIYYNNGNRTFTMDPVFDEYIQVAMFDRFVGKSAWDTNGEPLKDLIIQREACLPPKLDTIPKDRIDHCATRPTHSFAVYRYDEEAKSMVQTHSTHTSHGNFLRGMQAEDIDGDNKMDLILLTHKFGVEIFYSKLRIDDEPMFADGTEPDEIIASPDGTLFSFAIVEDFNLDGEMELVLFAHNTTSKKPALVTYMYTRNPLASEPPYFELVQALNAWPYQKDDRFIKDIAAIDYNNDGYKDISYVSHKMHFLTNTFLTGEQGQSQCDKPQFLAVVLQGKIVNEYGIGASVRLKARNVGPYQNETRWFSKTVNSYSHGTTMNGGNQDHRLVFGLGKMGKPLALEVVWPDGQKTKFWSEWNLEKKMNDMMNPFVVNDMTNPSIFKHQR